MEVFGEGTARFGTEFKVEETHFVPGTAWLFIKNRRGVVKSAMHLDDSSARDLRDALDKFIGDYGV